jgi:hypothetical protein
MTMAREREGAGRARATAATRKLRRGPILAWGQERRRRRRRRRQRKAVDPAIATYGNGDKNRDSNNARMLRRSRL